jgi:Zn finger protein HypA/HybF involved in hydrogenase expression
MRTKTIAGHADLSAMQKHRCGYEQDIYCRYCNIPLEYDEKRGLHCPRCRRTVTMICHGCGQRW